MKILSLYLIIIFTLLCLSYVSLSQKFGFDSSDIESPIWLTFAQNQDASILSLFSRLIMDGWRNPLDHHDAIHFYDDNTFSINRTRETVLILNGKFKISNLELIILYDFSFDGLKVKDNEIYLYVLYKDGKAARLYNEKYQLNYFFIED